MRYLLSLFALFAVLATTAQADDVPGVTDDKILVGMTTDMTGPLAFVGQRASAGARLYFDHINAQGGVHGRQIELRVEDDGYSPPRAVAAVRKLLDRDNVFCFVGNLGTATTLATLPFIERERVPLILPLTLSSQMSTPAKRYVFALNPNYQVEAWLIAQYIAEVEQTAAPRLAVLYQDDDAGQDGLKGLRQAAAHYGMPLIAEESYKRGAVDFSSQALNLRQADPTHVVLLTVYREAAAIMKEAHQAEWSPQFIGWVPCADDKTVELAGEAAEGFLGLHIIDFQGENEPMQLYHKLRTQHSSDTRPGLYHAASYGAAQLLVEGLQRAGRELTREKLVEALETLDRWDGSVLPPFTYGPNLRGSLFTSAFITKADIQNKKLVRASDWLQFKQPTKMAQQGN